MNIWKLIYLNCGEWYEDMIDHRSYPHNSSSCEIKGVPAHDLYDTGAVLYQLSYQANWELATVWVCNNKWIYVYENSYIWTGKNDSLIAQWVEHCTGIAEVMGLNPIQAWFFFQVHFTYLFISPRCRVWLYRMLKQSATK